MENDMKDEGWKVETIIYFGSQVTLKVSNVFNLDLEYFSFSWLLSILTFQDSYILSMIFPSFLILKFILVVYLFRHPSPEHLFPSCKWLS
jgi:hypothetical protein